MTSSGALRLCLVAGEHSGDALGAPLIEALRHASRRPLEIVGVGGELMAAQGLQSLFPLSEVAVMGPLAILARLPQLLRRIRQTADAAIAANIDALVIIDSPEFTHRVARRVRKQRPHLPIIDYVSPSVWAWRPGRARKMRAYVDHILAILPFEPSVHERLGGPECTYVGHPLAQRVDELYGEEAQRDRDVLLVLPGSRVTEVRRLMQPFMQAVEKIAAARPQSRIVIPAAASVRPLIVEAVRNWPVDTQIVDGEAAKFAAFKHAGAALAASGTVTLELALAGVPMAVAYRLDPVAAALRFLMSAHSIVLPNLILGKNTIPEFIQQDCTPARLSQCLLSLLDDGPARDAQLAAFRDVRRLTASDGATPSARAAAQILKVIAP